MKLSQRDRRALLLLAAAGVVMLLLKLSTGSGPEVAEAAVDSVDMAEKKLVKLRQISATVPGREALLKQAGQDAGERILRALHMSVPKTN